jgi:hypothetical protein
MSNSKIRVRHVGPGRARMSTERTDEFAACRHPVTFEVDEQRMRGVSSCSCSVEGPAMYYSHSGT